MPIPDFKFLTDEPLTSEGLNYFDFYHGILAPALKDILKNDTTPQTIGLFGSWGTGKSTIIEMVRDDKELNMPVFIFDAWKYQEDSLRRIFLIKLVEFLETQDIKIDASILRPLYKNTSASTAKTVAKTKSKLSKKQKIGHLFKKFWLPMAMGLLIVGYIILNIALPQTVAANLVKDAVATLAAISFLGILVKPVIEGFLKKAVETFFEKQSESVDLRTEIEQEERLNSPEQFEDKFKQILKGVDQRMIIVFDNVDRVQGDVAISMLSTIKTFLYSGDAGPIFIVPCDVEAIEAQVNKYFEQTKSNTEDSEFSATEYLRKVFNLVIWVPEFISSDLEEFTKASIQETGDISKLLNDEDLILVVSSAFSKNPREIIQFINNLVAMTITAQGTSVKTTINSNIAYLAKVLVLRQKFPKAYQKLKLNWYSPENILGDNPSDSLKDFMNKTNRITVEDAEPYIYFKDPADSRGLQDPSQLKNALVSGDVDEATNLVTKEPNKMSVANYIMDLLQKYTGQEQVLVNVLNAQFQAFNALDTSVDSKKYFNTIASVIDTQLWGRYQSLPIGNIFTLISNNLVDAKVRKALAERLVATLDNQETITVEKRDIDKSILENFLLFPALLNSSQRSRIKALIEQKYSQDFTILGVYKLNSDQTKYVSKETIGNYINTIDYKNIRARVNNLRAYKEFVEKQDLLALLIDRVGERLTNANAITPDYSPDKKEVIEGIATVADIFRSSLKSIGTEMDTMISSLVQTYNGTTTREGWVQEARAFWWLEGFVSPENNDIVVANVTSFFAKPPAITELKLFIESWSEGTAQSLIKRVLPTLLPLLSSNEEILSYIYSKADRDTKVLILKDVIERTPLDNLYDINFIKKLRSTPDRMSIVEDLLTKAGKQTYTHKTDYYDYIAEKMSIKDSRNLKDAVVAQVTALEKTNEPDKAEVGYKFFENVSALGEADRREVARNILAWLRAPEASVGYIHRYALSTITHEYGILQETMQKDYIYLLFNLLDASSTKELIEFVVDTLNVISPSYKQFTKDFDDLAVRLEAWPDNERKRYIAENLTSLKSKRQTKAEKAFWEVVEKNKN